MKTDSIFYRLFLEFPSIFFELLGLPPDTARDYQFKSQEIKQLSFRIDGLFLPSIEESDRPFYLVEVQFQSDDTLYSRLFCELFLYLRQYKVANPWRLVVIYPTRSMEREENRQFQELLTLEWVKRVYIDTPERLSKSVELSPVVHLILAEIGKNLLEKKSPIANVGQ